MKTPKGNIELALTDAQQSRNGGMVIGTELYASVKNLTNVDVRHLKFELIYLDQDGQKLHVCLGNANFDHVCAINVHRILRNGVQALVLPGTEFRPDRPLPLGKKITSFAARVMEMWYSPEYVFETTAKQVPPFDIHFSVDVEEGIAFELRNKLETPIEIVWDQSSFVNAADESSRLVHGSVKYVDKEHSQPSTTVPPFAKLSENVFPTNNINLSNSRWSKTPLLPAVFSLTDDTSRVDALVGKSLRLFLRMMIEEKKVDYLATFTITSINR